MLYVEAFVVDFCMKPRIRFRLFNFLAAILEMNILDSEWRLLGKETTEKFKKQYGTTKGIVKYYDVVI